LTLTDDDSIFMVVTDTQLLLKGETMELGTEVVGRDGQDVFVVTDRWVPMDGYEARTVQGIDGETGERFGRHTQLRKVGETEWFRA
jgi:hypothetical protein